MQTVKGVKVRCIKLLKNKVYKFARYTIWHINNKQYINWSISQINCKLPFLE